MSTTTPVNGWTIPTLSDVPNVETSFHPAFNAIDQRVIPIFTTTGLRDSAIPTPTFGQHAAVSGTGEVYFYNGSAWCSSAPRTKYKTTNENVPNSTVMQNDDVFFMSVEANALYYIELYLVMVGDPAADFKMQWTFPAGTDGIRWRNALVTAAVTDADNKSQIDTVAGGSSTSGVLNATTPRTFLQESLTVDTAGTAGTLQLQWAQNVANATATTIQAGSVMRCWKVG